MDIEIYFSSSNAWKKNYIKSKRLCKQSALGYKYAGGKKLRNKGENERCRRKKECFITKFTYMTNK